MARRPGFNCRYLLNTDPDHLEVHDLDNEQTGENECQIDEIIKAGNAKPLTGVNNEGQLAIWLKNKPNYDGGKYCLPQFHKK